MGHAGAIISGQGESAAEKMQIMEDCGVTVVKRPSEFGSTVAQVLAQNNT
jgi:succinyl-CoA synthetase alpha subunit